MDKMKQKTVQQKAIVRRLTTSLRKRKNSKSKSNVNLNSGVVDFDNGPKQSKTAIVALDANTATAVSPVSKTHITFGYSDTFTLGGAAKNSNNNNNNNKSITNGVKTGEPSVDVTQTETTSNLNVNNDNLKQQQKENVPTNNENDNDDEKNISIEQRNTRRLASVNDSVSQVNLAVLQPGVSSTTKIVINGDANDNNNNNNNNNVTVTHLERIIRSGSVPSFEQTLNMLDNLIDLPEMTETELKELNEPVSLDLHLDLQKMNINLGDNILNEFDSRDDNTIGASSSQTGESMNLNPNFATILSVTGTHDTYTDANGNTSVLSDDTIPGNDDDEYDSSVSSAPELYQSATPPLSPPATPASQRSQTNQASGT